MIHSFGARSRPYEQVKREGRVHSLEMSAAGQRTPSGFYGSMSAYRGRRLASTSREDPSLQTPHCSQFRFVAGETYRPREGLLSRANFKRNLDFSDGEEEDIHRFVT